MVGLLCALTAVLAAPGAFADGTWLPTQGGGGERLISAIAGGGDGALYAAGAGMVHRLVPGQPWKVLGAYAPNLVYTSGEGIEAEGNFDPRFLDKVEEDVTLAVENSMGAPLDGEQATEDIVSGLLAAYVEEPDPDPESPYHVARVVPSTRGVWIATGSGLFWADAKGVTGPIGDLGGLLDIAATPKGLAAVTDVGLFRIDPNGRSTLWVQRKITSLTTVAGQIAFVADGLLYLEGQNGQVRTLKPPTGAAELIAGDEQSLWVSTPLALFRWEADQWNLCPATPVVAERMVAGADSLALLTETGLHVTDKSCGKLGRIEPPWLGSLQFTDAALFAGSLWAASTDGVFVLGPKDAGAAEGLQAEAFRRAVDRLPRFDWIYDASLTYQNMQRAQHSFGERPLYAGLLPIVRGTSFTRPSRRETDPTLTIGNDVLDQDQPTFNWTVMLEWNIRFDVIGALLDTSTSADAEELVIEQEEVDAYDDYDEYDSSLEIDGETTLVEVVSGDVDVDAADAADVAYAKHLAERRQLTKDQGKLYRDLRGLYRERLRVMQSIWRSGPGDQMVTNVLRLDEIDAQFDALTGGAFSRQLGADAPVRKEGG